MCTHSISSIGRASSSIERASSSIERASSSIERAKTSQPSDLPGNADSAPVLPCLSSPVSPDAQVVDASAENKAEDALLKQTKELYLSQSVSTTAKAWNDVREKVLQDALDNVLKPQFERELRAKLVSDAREFACSKCSSKVWRLATQAPIQVRLTRLA